MTTITLSQKDMHRFQIVLRDIKEFLHNSNQEGAQELLSCINGVQRLATVVSAAKFRINWKSRSGEIFEIGYLTDWCFVYKDSTDATMYAAIEAGFRQHPKYIRFFNAHIRINVHKLIEHPFETFGEAPYSITEFWDEPDLANAKSYNPYIENDLPRIDFREH